jgi:hypothetical protein
MTKPALVDRPDLSETFADVLCSVSTVHGLARVELAVTRPHPTDQEPRTNVMVARLLLSPLVAASLAPLLAKATEEFEKMGLIRRGDIPTKQ